MSEPSDLDQRKAVCTLALDLLKLGYAASIGLEAESPHAEVDNAFWTAEEYFRHEAEYLDDQQPKDEKP
jgi:hypothetical protein